MTGHSAVIELTKDLAEKMKLVLGAEMLEADNQKQLNQYLKENLKPKQHRNLLRRRQK